MVRFRPGPTAPPNLEATIAFCPMRAEDKRVFR